MPKQSDMRQKNYKNTIEFIFMLVIYGWTQGLFKDGF